MATREPSSTSTAFKLGELTAEVRELIHQNANIAQVNQAGFDRMDKRLDKLDTKATGTEVELARLKHRGAGILVGLSLAFTAVGITLSEWVRDAIKAIF